MLQRCYKMVCVGVRGPRKCREQVRARKRGVQERRGKHVRGRRTRKGLTTPGITSLPFTKIGMLLTLRSAV
jgi:hypothetical protein